VSVPELIPPNAFAVFEQQDSGCVSYGIVRGGQRRFVKIASTPAARRSLTQAITFHESVRHPAIVSPVETVDTADLQQVTYPWVDGVVLNHATVAGSDRSGLYGFRRLSVDEALAAIDTVLDAHVAVSSAGFVSVDLYDGCFLYDFNAKVMHLIDLDEYRPGPFVLEEERLPGSTRYMAPEELVRGATVDDRTTAFHLGRTIAELLGESSCTERQRAVVLRATHHQVDARFQSVEDMVTAWRSATK
jgi:serine/threonine-protein kinase